MALSPTINIMLRAAEKAARSLIRDFGEVEQLQVSRKGPGDFVTAADIRSEEILFNELQKARPDYDFLMEERGAVTAAAGGAKSEYRWIIDPLDGTSNFMHGLPHWNISIALEHNNEIIAGIVYDPVKDEMFRAEKGQGAFIRNKRLRVSGRTNFDSAMIACGAPLRSGVDQSFSNSYMAVKKTGANVRRMGAAALDMAYVAAGRFEGYWERRLKPWDAAAGYILIREAGGKIVDLDGKRDSPIFTGNVICSNFEIYNEFYKIISEAEKSGQKAA